MRRQPSFKTDDFVIWTTCLCLAAVLGSVSAYAVSVAATGAGDMAASFKEMLALVAAGLGLIVLALHGKLVRAFLIAFAAVFFVALAVATHGFSAL